MINIANLKAEIEAENTDLSESLGRHIMRPEVSLGDAVMAEALIAIHRRLGDMMILQALT